MNAHLRLADAAVLNITMQAQALLPVILHELQILDEEDLLRNIFSVDVSPLYNGRERGYCVVLTPEGSPGTAPTLVVFWAEDRGSDFYFVWSWERPGAVVNMPPELPKDDGKSYRNRPTFPHLQLYDGAQCFREIVTEWLKRVDAAFRMPPEFRVWLEERDYAEKQWPLTVAELDLQVARETFGDKCVHWRASS